MRRSIAAALCFLASAQQTSDSGDSRTFDNGPVYAVFGVYLASMFGIALHGMANRRKAEAAGVDGLEAHFLANKVRRGFSDVFGHHAIAYITSLSDCRLLSSPSHSPGALVLRRGSART